MGQSRERISDIRKDIRPDNRSDKIIIYSDQFSGLILHLGALTKGLGGPWRPESWLRSPRVWITPPKAWQRPPRALVRALKA